VPPLADSYYERFWAACADFGLALVIHIGYGFAQGKLLRTVQEFEMAAGAAVAAGDYPSVDDYYADRDLRSGTFDRPSVESRQVLWQLMLGGVFDRYPSLRVVPTEVRGDWIPATMRHLDERLADVDDFPMASKPSHYWERHGFVGISFIHRAEVEMRYEIGVDHMMFGRDYPHPEGTWPNTWNWLRAALADIPEGEARLILGENAIRCYHLDRDRLAKIAARVGPYPEDILGSHHHVDSRYIADFDRRGGFHKPPESVDTDLLNDILDRDLAELRATREPIDLPT
jgi:predicted TIM-barrel fold metal-dependent hydrolase